MKKRLYKEPIVVTNNKFPIINNLHIPKNRNLSVINPNYFELPINNMSINNLIRFKWCSVSDCNEFIEKGYKYVNTSYFGNNFYYKLHPQIYNILLSLTKEQIENYITVDIHGTFDYGLIKKALLIASLDNNYDVIDLLISKSIDINKIYFDGITILEYVTKLFRCCDNIRLIQLLILYGANSSKLFKDGTPFFQNFIDASTKMTVNKFTAINKHAFQLYKDNKMKEFYDIYHNYSILNISKNIFTVYIPILLSINVIVEFTEVDYLISRTKYNLYLNKIQ